MFDQTGDEAENANTFITLCIHAGIAAADVICCARLGEHAQGESYDQSLTMLEKADGGAARHLRVLLGMKTKIGYSHIEATAAEAKRAGRAAEALVKTARRVNAGG